MSDLMIMKDLVALGEAGEVAQGHGGQGKYWFLISWVVTTEADLTQSSQQPVNAPKKETGW